MELFESIGSMILTLWEKDPLAFITLLGVAIYFGVKWALKKKEAVEDEVVKLYELDQAQQQKIDKMFNALFGDPDIPGDKGIKQKFDDFQKKFDLHTQTHIGVKEEAIKAAKEYIDARLKK